MAKDASRVATRGAARPATRQTARAAQPAARTAQTAQTARPAQATASRAAQPAQRAPAPAQQQNARQAAPAARTAPPAEPRSNVPARRPDPAPAPMLFGDPSQVPDYMRGDIGAGKENIGTEDLQVPRLKLIQGTSKELQVYNELRVGDFFHTASEMIFNEPFPVVPLYMEKRFILWRPLDDGGGILARADDGVHWSPSEGQFTVKLDRVYGGKQVTWKLARTVQQSGLSNWGTMDPDDKNSPPAATMMYNYVFAFPSMPELMPAVFTFQRSQIRTGRDLNTRLRSTPVPSYGLVYELWSNDARNTANKDYKGVTITSAGFVEKPMYPMMKAMAENLRQTGLQVRDIETLQEEDILQGGDPAEVGGDQNGRGENIPY